MIERITNACVVSGTHGCHIWQKATSRGYGVIRFCVSEDDNGVKKYCTTSPHKLLCMLVHNVVEMPENLDISHICGNKQCCNPQHLRVETRRQNSFRCKCHTQKRRFGHIPRYIV